MEKLKAALANKITSKEEFDEILLGAHRSNLIGLPEARSEDRRTVTRARTVYATARHTYVSPNGLRVEDLESLQGISLPSYLAPRNLDGAYLGEIHHTRWWMLRDHLRILLNYPTSVSDVMEPMVRLFAELSIHKRADDDDITTVWYTPDPASGERDAPVRTTLARLIRKLYPGMPDETIRDLEAEHRAEMNNEIEFVTGAAIPDAYMAGPSSCMSYAASHWGNHLDGHHPTEVYDAPGFALAVNRAAGRINSRCLTWVNPEDPTDKRAVRLYGDLPLMRKLRRAGYREAGLVGAKIKAIELMRDDATRATKFVVPYIDYAGGRSGSTLSGRTVVRDGDMLRIIGDTDRDPIRSGLVRRGVPTLPVGSTAGCCWVYDVHDVKTLNTQCPLTGVTFTPDESTRNVWIDGGIKPVHSSADLEGWVTLKHHSKSGEFVDVLAPEGTKTFEARIKYGGFDKVSIIDCDTNRRVCGFVRLDEKLYPLCGWTDGLDAIAMIAGEGSTTLILRSDAVDVVSMIGGATTRVMAHKSTVPKDYKKIHRINSTRPAFVAPDIPVHKTPSGRSVVIGQHEVAECVDGSVDFLRNLHEHRYFGVTVYTRSAAIEDPAVAGPVLKALTAKLTSAVGAAVGTLRTGNAVSRQRAEENAWLSLSVALSCSVGHLPVLRDGHADYSYASKFTYLYAVLRRSHNDAFDPNTRENIIKFIAACEVIERTPEAERTLCNGAGYPFNQKMYAEAALPAVRAALALITAEKLDEAEAEGRRYTQEAAAVVESDFVALPSSSSAATVVRFTVAA